MFKKLGLMALSTVVLGSPLLSIASADSVETFNIIGNNNYEDSFRIEGTYTPSFFTTNGGIFNFIDYSGLDCDSNFQDVGEIEECSMQTSVFRLHLENSDNYTYCGNLYDNLDGNITNDFDYGGDCRNFYLDPGTYTIFTDRQSAFSNVSFTITSNSGSSDSDGSIGIPSGFTDSVNGLVSNFAGSIGNYAPTLIIVGLGVVLLFTFWGVIRSWAVRILSKKGR